MHNGKDLKAIMLLNEELLEENFNVSEKESTELNALYDEHACQFKAGQLLSGVVLEKDNGGLLVDVSYKSYGTIPHYEFSKHEFETVKAGDKLEVLLDRLEDENGNVVLSYQKAKSMKAWEKIIELAKNDEPVTGTVLHKVKGGLSVDIGIPAFLPGSQVDVQRVSDFDAFIGKEVECKILKVNKKRGNVIISRRKHLEVARQAVKSQVLETISEDQVLEGIAKNITNYGVFVDVGGVDGLLHITDMSWGRVNHPSELVKIGDTITVKVIGLDKENEKISLGMKQLIDNPWDGVEDQYPLGKKIKGKVSSITDYGLFVEVARGIEGLVHISEISWTERITNLNKYYTVGQEIDVVVVALDKENRRMSLSIKQMSEDPWQTIAAKFNIGDKITGKVSNVTDFGIFVELSDGVDGLVHVSDVSWTDHITHPNDHFSKGDTVDAIILGMDAENKKISLGIKQLENDPWQSVEKEYPVGSSVTGTVSKLTNFGAFIRLESGIEGLVHISEIPQKTDDQPNGYEIGETREFKVIKVNQEERKLGLSAKDGASTSTQQTEKFETSAPRKEKTVMKSVLQQALEDHQARAEDEEEK